MACMNKRRCPDCQGGDCQKCGGKGWVHCGGQIIYTPPGRYSCTRCGNASNTANLPPPQKGVADPRQAFNFKPIPADPLLGVNTVPPDVVEAVRGAAVVEGPGSGPPAAQDAPGSVQGPVKAESPSEGQGTASQGSQKAKGKSR
jgi:hypothetical protein